MFLITLTSISSKSIPQFQKFCSIPSSNFEVFECTSLKSDFFSEYLTKFGHFLKMLFEESLKILKIIDLILISKYEP